jgi:hypothetical protein
MAKTIHDLSIVNQATNKVTPVQSIQGGVTAGELLAAYAQQIGLPDNARGKLVRKLTQVELQSSQTLEGAGVEDGETLIAYIDMVPGVKRV